MQWYGVGGETLLDIKHFGSNMPHNYNTDFLVPAETPEEAFRMFYTKRCVELEKKLEHAKRLAALYK